LMVELRHLIQIALAAVAHDAARSAPSTPGEGGRMSLSPNVGVGGMAGRGRIPSARSPSIAHRLPLGSPSIGADDRRPSASPGLTLTPDSGGLLGHSRMPSQSLTPSLGHGRLVSASLASGVNGPRPSFADLSARRVSRPAFAIPGGNAMRYRFPSSQPVRQLGEKGQAGGGGGAIIHLLGAPHQVLGATSATIPSAGVSGKDEIEEALRDVRIGSQALSQGARRSVRACRVVFGLGKGVEEDIKVWTRFEAIVSVASFPHRSCRRENSTLVFYRLIGGCRG
jgi:hypothetical protein